MRLRVGLASCMVVYTALLIYLPGRGDDQGEKAHGPLYTVLQMNLCLSGRAACSAKVDYPDGVDEAVTRIIESHADAVTMNEACSGDVGALARLTHYDMRFAAARQNGSPLPCINPGNRGNFGNAILTRQDIVTSAGDAFLAQDEVEQRRWLCATTADGVTVCTTHLDVRWSSSTQTVNDAQCTEFAHVLDHYESLGPTVAAGDMNRADSCSPAGSWTRSDAGARQDAGMQQAYGNAAFASPESEVVPMTHTDHDALVVTSVLAHK